MSLRLPEKFLLALQVIILVMQPLECGDAPSLLRSPSLPEAALKLVQDYFSEKRTRKVVIYACSIFDTVRLWRSLSEAGMWLVADAEEVSGIGRVGATSSLPEVQFYRTGCFLDLRCLGGQALLQQVSELQLLNNSYDWLLWGPLLPTQAKNLNLRMDSEVTVVAGRSVYDPVEDVDKVAILWDLHKVHPHQPMLVETAGQWSADTGLRYVLREYKFARRKLQGISLRTAIVITNGPTSRLHWRLTRESQRHIDSLTKFNYAIFVHLEQLFNFTMDLRATKSWGYLTGKRTFDGMVGMLQRGEVEIAATSAIFKKERFEVVDYTGHSWKFRPCFLFRHPATVSVRGVLFEPFSRGVWLSVMALTLAAAAASRAALMAEVRLGDAPALADAPDTEPLDTSYSGALFLAVSAISQQGAETRSVWAAWHLLSFFIFASSYLIYTYYSAGVVSSLLLPPPRTIRTLRDLIDSPLEVGLEDVTYNRDYFLHGTDALGRELYQKKVFPPGRRQPAYYSLAEGMLRMQMELFAFHTEVSTAYPLIEHRFTEEQKCALGEVQMFTPSIMSVPIQKRSQYRELIIFGMRKATERGLLRREERVWRPDKPRCTGTGDVAAVTVAAMLPAFLLVVAGVLAGVVFLLPAEKYFAARHRILRNIRKRKLHSTAEKNCLNHWRCKENITALV